MAARTLLLKLQGPGWIQLPERRWASPTRSGRGEPRAGARSLEERLLASSLRLLGPRLIDEVSQLGRHERRAPLEACRERYPYLGDRSRVGQNLPYWIRSAPGRPLAGVVFGAPAWQGAVRDRWIGWTRTQRAQPLGWVLNTTRFLILPWVRVPHLATPILGGIRRRIGADWQAKYQHPLYLLETFVDRRRFAGTCYRAANGIALGQTQGRGRQGSHQPSTSIKDLYAYPLHPRCRQHLTREGSEPMIRQRHAEAMRRGLACAQRVLVIADGAVWIGNAVADRFSEATQRLDLFHANAYLGAVANQIHGTDSPAARQWVKPLLQPVRQDKVAQVIRTLDELKPRLNAAAAQAATKAVEYDTSNPARMKDVAGQKRGEPLGSGAIESTCRQRQCRMKRGGQFGSTAGDEALLCLEIFRRHDRWELLFPHVGITAVAGN